MSEARKRMKVELSPRMIAVMRGLCEGRIGKEIASEHKVSVRTVESQIQEAKRRLKAKNIAPAVHLYTLAEVQGKG